MEAMSIDEHKTEEFNGLVTDQTISKFGHDFYDYFSSGLELPEDVSIVAVHEYPNAISGSLIIVEVDDIPIFQQRLSFKAYEIEDKALEARETFYMYLLSKKIEESVQ
jgi:curli production assembly/transport component CsgE